MLEGFGDGVDVGSSIAEVEEVLEGLEKVVGKSEADELFCIIVEIDEVPRLGVEAADIELINATALRTGSRKSFSGLGPVTIV